MQNNICSNCTQPFEITAEDQEYYVKFEVPEPKNCPDCRQQRRIAFRNDRNYYRRMCDMCHKSIISIYSEDKPFPVYCRDCFWSDKYNPLDYGREFDTTRPFMEQFEEMRSHIPRIAIFNTQSENSDFTVHSSRNRNCYMGSSFVECEDVYYGDWIFYSKDSMDLYISQKMEQSYFCTDCEECYHGFYLENCQNINDSYLCFDCRGSSNLIGCVGLRKKGNYILNKSVSKEAFAIAMKRLKTEPEFRTDLEKEYKKLRLSVPVKSFWERNTENCSGNYIVNSKNAQYAYNVKDIEDGRHIYECGTNKDIMDVTRSANGEFLYECKGAVDLQYGKFCNLCYQSSNLEYCDNCQSSHDSFGCMGLKNNRFCILNKQYSETEYRELIQKIKAHMMQTDGPEGVAYRVPSEAGSCEYGEFFPITISPFGYNETKAQEFFPLTKEQALAKGYKWHDDDVKDYKAQTYKIPDDIFQVSDTILQEVLACKTCNKNFKIVPQELKLYRQLELPIPHDCQECRHHQRMATENPRKHWSRTCAKCGTSIQTTYSPDKPEIVYCEKCYLEAVY